MGCLGYGLFSEALSADSVGVLWDVFGVLPLWEFHGENSALNLLHFVFSLLAKKLSMEAV